MGLITMKKSQSPWSWIPSLYFAEGLPYVAVMVVAGIMYKRLGLDNDTIAVYTGWLNLTFSIVIYPDFLSIIEQFIISQIVSLAIKEVLDLTEQMNNKITVLLKNIVTIIMKPTAQNTVDYMNGLKLFNIKTEQQIIHPQTQCLMNPFREFVPQAGIFLPKKNFSH